MAESLMILSVISFLLAGVFGMISVVLWFQFDIPGILKDLRGRTAERSGSEKQKTFEEEVEDTTERLERVPDPSKTGRKNRDMPENVMIIHTDEEIELSEGEFPGAKRE